MASASATTVAASQAPAPAVSKPSDKDGDHHHNESIAEIKEKYAKDIASLRGLLDLPCPDDVMVYRFLRGHNFDQKTAAKHLNHTLHLRKQYNLDELRKKAAKLEQRQFPHAEKVLAVHPHNINHGVDRKGQPLSIERLGHSNPYLMVRTVKFDMMLAYHFYHMESKAALVNSMSESSGHVVRTCKIMDLSGLGRQHLDRRGLAYFKKLIDLSQHAYPEMLGDLYIVNTPWIFGMGWKLVSPWLNDATKSKIHILPNDKYKQLLAAAIEPKYIPDFLGGTCTCGGQGCVPLRDPDAGLTTVQIGGRGKHEHKFTVDAAEFERLRKEAAANDAAEGDAAAAAATDSSEGFVGAGSFRGVCVRYEFRTQKNDVGFEIRTRPLAGPNYAAAAAAATSTGDAAAAAAAAPASAAALPQQAESSSWTVIRASKRYSSDQEPVSDSFVLSAPAEVCLFFDNSFSMFTGKTVLFRTELDAQVDHPQDAEENSIASALQDTLISEPESASAASTTQ